MNLRNLFRRKRAPQPERYYRDWEPMTLEELLSGRDYPDDALSIATVYRCVKLLSESVAQLPLQYMRRRGEVFVPYDCDLSYLLSVEPDAAMSAFDFWRQIGSDVFTRGNAYIVPQRHDGDIFRLARCNPDKVQHDLQTDTYTISDDQAGISGRFEEWQVIHIKGLGGNPKHGLSVLSYARTTLTIADLGDKETRKRFGNGGGIRGFITNVNQGGTGKVFGKHTTEQLDTVAGVMEAGLNAGRRIFGLYGSADFHQMMMTSADMQFLETRKFTAREICRFFGVHPSFVFDDTSNNYKSAENANVAFLSTTLNPILYSIESELERKLIPRVMRRDYRIRFDRRGLHACDLDSQARYQTQRIQAGLSTINEERIADNMPPVEGGDTLVVSANLRRLDEISNPQQQPDANG